MRGTQAEPFLFRLHNVQCRVLLFCESESQPLCICLRAAGCRREMHESCDVCADIWWEFDLLEVEHTVDYDIDLLLYIPPIDTL